MFPWGNSENPLESLFKRPSFQLYDHQNPFSNKHPEDSQFFCNFPSPFFDEHELPLHQIPPAANQCAPPDQSPHNTSHSPKPKFTSSKEKAPITTSHVARRRSLGVVPRKRTAGKKDRHSKICTAQGVRDRRMRLSLQVARKFFDLQDMLGYDKASKTIEWLFNKSKKAIKDLIREKNNICISNDGGNNNNNNNNSISDGKSESFLSECEVVSGIEENSNSGAAKSVSNSGRPRKTAGKPNLRESREKARARARCRTREKMMSKGLGSGSGSGPNVEKLGPFDQESGPVSPYDADVGTIEKLLGNCIDPNSNFMGFLGNWDLLNNGRINFSHTNQLAGIINSNFSDSTPDFPLFDHQ